MNLSELVDTVAGQTVLTKAEASKAVAAVFDSIKQELIKGGTVRLVGFGSFSVVELAARDGRNPRTGETVKIEASKKPVFRAGKELKDALKG